ncbi:DgyrCDS10227 [Dimorphilus gyrociliatus]|uniref:Cilia- and flagella-associated protein 43 n=1 Tax=Dimorphilus gyrociliatus TaxID=2664684 RepID=A0A7I8VZL1_9ANNE|nr:DgyrCDS10227 [Dimorphilus gyrociliatus]
MDSIGTFQIRWSQGYEGGNIQYINKDTIVIKCGNNLKFIRNNSGETSEDIYSCPGGGIGTFAVHSLNKVFAVSKSSIKPSILIVNYPDLQQKHELKNGAALEYQCMQFSSSSFLVSISGVPDFQMVLWNYQKSEKLSSVDFGTSRPTNLSFDPTNWRRMVTTTEKNIKMWTVEQCDSVYRIFERKYMLPGVDGSLPQEHTDISKQISRPDTSASYAAYNPVIQMTRRTLAGLIDDEDDDDFELYMDEVGRVLPISHVWTPKGDILIGCEGGQLLEINTEDESLRFLYYPDYYREFDDEVEDPEIVAIQKETSQSSENIEREQTKVTIAEGSDPMGLRDSFKSLILHKNGLFAGGKDGVLRQFEYEKRFKLLKSQPVGKSISSLSFNTKYDKLIVGSDEGYIGLYQFSSDLNISERSETIIDLSYGQFVAVDVLYDNETNTDICITARENGDIQSWDSLSSSLLCTLSLGLHISVVSSSPLSSFAAVGTTSGHVYFIDATNPKSLRVVHCTRLHDGGIRQLTFDNTGDLLLSGSDDGFVYVVNARPSKYFETIGFIEYPGNVVALSALKLQNDSIKVAVTVSDNSTGGATRICHFVLPNNIRNKPEEYYQDLRCQFDSNKISLLKFNFNPPIYGLALVDPNTIFGIDQATKKLMKMKLPDEPPKKERSKDSYLQAVETYACHGTTGGSLKLSSHNKWLLSCAPDGRIIVRSIGAPERMIDLQAHDLFTGGSKSAVFSSDGHYLFSTGRDGVLNCFTWRVIEGGEGRLESSSEELKRRQGSLAGQRNKENSILSNIPQYEEKFSRTTPPPSTAEQLAIEEEEKLKQITEAIEKDQIFETPTPKPAADATWLDRKKLEAVRVENKQFEDLKKDLRCEIRDIRRKLQGMMKENENVPDIEQLNRHEFDLDVEEQERLRLEGDAEVLKIRREKELENLAKMYLADIIKKECWDDMKVKGRGITSFHLPLEVYNYPLRERTEQELNELRIVQEQRRIEIAEYKERKLHAEHKQSLASINPQQDEEGGEDEEEIGDKMAITGSSGAEYGGASEYFYSQFDLHNREQKMNQIVLLKDAIYRIKQTFNKEFDEIYTKKETEISKINEKNKRIKKILSDLDLHEEIFCPSFGPIEKPELLLTVHDDEIKVEKYLTPEQRKKMEQDRKLEEERRARERADNWRERGLDQMMNGVLEIRKEDELKKDVPRPAFMDKKSEDDWSDDEKRIAEEYKQKVIALNEEREKFRKQLDMELKKLQAATLENSQAFDETLQNLFQRKIKTEMAVYQEELKIQRLRLSMLVEEELKHREKELLELLMIKKAMQTETIVAVQESKKNVEAFKETLENLTAESQLLDKGFKREFNDCTALHLDLLSKLFRRRPKGLKAVRTSDTPIFDVKSGNPYSGRPPSARDTDDIEIQVAQAMMELDKMSNAPEGVEKPLWDRFCRYRRSKYGSELIIKKKSEILAEMNKFLQKRQKEEDETREEIDSITSALNTLREERMRFSCNLEVQIVMKQGQVEVDPGNFIHNFKDSILVHRSVIEDLNFKIQTLGESKISSMVESKDFRKGIAQLQWEHKRMLMQTEDLKNKMKDIQNLKVTREVQTFLHCADYDAKKQQEIAILEETINKCKKVGGSNLSC